MDEKALVFFRKTAELEHITKAAKELYVSQAQLSRTITEIEHELGTQLFDRTGRNIKLNSAGKVFYEYVLKISAEYGEAKTAVQSAAQQKMFQVSLGTNVGTYTPELLSHLAEKTPGVNIRESSAPRNALTAMLRDGRIDFAIAGPPINDLALNTELLVVELPCVIYPPDHWLKGHDEISLTEIKNETFIGVPRGYGARDSMDLYYDALHIHPRFAVETANTNAVGQYVSRGLGIAIVPKSIALQSDYSSRHRVNLSDDVTCPIGISWIAEREFTERQTEFLDLTKQYFSERIAALLSTDNPS